MKLYFVLVPLLLISSCQPSKKEKDEDLKSIDKSQTLSSAEVKQARSLMENKCYLCHDPESSMDARVGPPMIAIKKHYARDAQNRNEFIESMWAFVQQPKKEKVKLKGAYEKFGLMPYQPYKEKDIKLIAAYMYDYQIEVPDWFEEHWKKGHQKRKGKQAKQGHQKAFKQRGKKFKSKTTDSLSYAQRGKKMAKATKKQLGKNLMKAIQEKGSAHAVEFCNVKAMPITNKMEKKFDARIQRVSDKNRNPQNKADEEELAFIQKFKQQLKENIEPKPEIVKENGKVNFYYPIVTNSMCLKCHGEPEKDINRATFAKINEYYPKDQAVNYTVNEVRGMWHIEFDE